MRTLELPVAAPVPKAWKGGLSGAHLMTGAREHPPGLSVPGFRHLYLPLSRLVTGVNNSFFVFFKAHLNWLMLLDIFTS